MFIPKKYLTETILFSNGSSLDESIFLTEAQATAKQLVIDLNKLDTLLPALLKELPNSKTLDIPNDLKKLCEDTLILITNAKVKNFKKFKDLKELMDHARKKASSIDTNEQFSDEKIKVLQPLCYSIASDGNSVKDRLKDIRSHKGAIASHITELQTRVPSLNANIEELYKLFEESKPENHDTEDPEDPKLQSGIDWTAEKAKRLKNANGAAASEILEKFYEDYYSIEYAGEATSDHDKKLIVDKLKSLNKLLTIEFNKLGYNPTVNPLAQFLKLLIKHKNDIFFKLTLNNYGAIHNAFIDRSITGNKLGNYNKKNILFCSDLYNYTGLEIVEYLALYKQTIDKAKTETQFADDPELLVSKMFIQQEQKEENYAKNVTALLSLSENDINLPTSNDAKMRSYLEISELYHHLFKEDVKQKISKTIADKISEEAEKAGVLKELFKYILDIDMLPSQEQTKRTEWFSQLKYESNPEHLSIVKQILTGYLIHDTSGSANLIDKVQLRIRASGIQEEPSEENKNSEKKD